MPEWQFFHSHYGTKLFIFQLKTAQKKKLLKTFDKSNSIQYPNILYVNE